MSATPTLGPVAFSGFEVPEQIEIGGRQRLAVHELPGGGRVVDTMGPGEEPIRWSGVFSGQNAAGRVRTLERLRRGGVQLLLSWDEWRYSVIIQKFQAEVTSSWWIPYRIELCVLPQGGLQQLDWLDAAVGPVLGVARLAGAALQERIDAAGAGLQASALTDVVSAAGELAKFVTERAYSGAKR
jgi:hypothetical protein